MVFQVFDGIHIGGDKSAKGSQGFAEGPHDDVDPIGEPEVFARAASAFPHHADTVSVVHHNGGTVFFRKLYRLGKRRNVAGHAEDSIHHNELAGCRSDSSQAVCEAGHVIMVKTHQGAQGQQATVHDTGVVLLVGDDIFTASHHGTDGTEVGLETRRIKEHGILAHEPGKGLLQLYVDI